MAKTKRVAIKAPLKREEVQPDFPILISVEVLSDPAVFMDEEGNLVGTAVIKKTRHTYRYSQSGKKIKKIFSDYSFTANIGDLRDKYKVDRYDHESGLGKDRMYNKRHGKGVGSYLHHGGIQLGETVVNIRNRKHFRVTEDPSLPQGTVAIFISKDAVLYSVDGQHRTLQQFLLDEDFGIDSVISLRLYNVTEREEVIIFLNHTTKGLSLDHNVKDSMMAKIASGREGDAMDRVLLGSGMTPKEMVKMSEASRRFAMANIIGKSDPLKTFVKPVNAEVTKGEGRVLSMHSVVDGIQASKLDEILVEEWGYPVRQAAELIVDFMRAVKQTWPSAFNQKTSLTKATAIKILLNVFAQILVHGRDEMKEKGISPRGLNPEFYISLLSQAGQRLDLSFAVKNGILMSEEDALPNRPEFWVNDNPRIKNLGNSGSNMDNALYIMGCIAGLKDPDLMVSEDSKSMAEKFQVVVEMEMRDFLSSLPAEESEAVA